MSNDRKHLLVVDDDRRLRDLLQRYLSENGFLVTVAKDAAEARLCLEETPFDLIILDIMMPGETGLELTRSIQNDPMHTAYSTPILFLTALTESENRIEGLESGGEGLLGTVGGNDMSCIVWHVKAL